MAEENSGGDGSNSVPTVLKNSVPMRPGRNGKGLLLAGGKPGNKGGTGRPSNAFKEACRLAAEEQVLPKIGRVVREQEPDTATGKPNPTWWQAAETMLRYGQSEAPKEIAAKISGAVHLIASRE